MGCSPSVSLYPGCEEVLDMPVATRNIEREPDRVVDAQVNLDFCRPAHDLPHVFEVIEREEGTGFHRGERYELVLRELAPDVVRVAFGNEIEGLVFRVDPERDLVRDHCRGLHRVVQVFAFDHDLARQVDGGRVRVFSDGVGVEERDRIVVPVHRDRHLLGIVGHLNADEVALSGHAEDVLHLHQVNAELAVRCLVRIERFLLESQSDHRHIGGINRPRGDAGLIRMEPALGMRAEIASINSLNMSASIVAFNIAYPLTQSLIQYIVIL